MPLELGIALTGIQASQFDPDSIAFLSAAGITSATEKYAINYLVTGLKLKSLWNKMDYINPFVGGTSTSMSLNLKNPIFYQGTFNGGWTFSGNGALANGTNAYFNTTFPLNSILQNDGHLSIYSRTDFNVLTSGTDIGASSASGIFSAIETRTGNISYGTINSAPFNSIAVPSSLGLFMTTRTSPTATALYVRTQGATGATGSFASSASVDATPITIGARNTNGTIAWYCPRQYAFASIGKGLNYAEWINLATIVQQFQTLLSRQV